MNPFHPFPLRGCNRLRHAVLLTLTTVGPAAQPFSPVQRALAVLAAAALAAGAVLTMVVSGAAAVLSLPAMSAPSTCG